MNYTYTYTLDCFCSTSVIISARRVLGLGLFGSFSLAIATCQNHRFFIEKHSVSSSPMFERSLPNSKFQYGRQHQYRQPCPRLLQSFGHARFQLACTLVAHIKSSCLVGDSAQGTHVDVEPLTLPCSRVKKIRPGTALTAQNVLTAIILRGPSSHVRLPESETS